MSLVVHAMNYRLPLWVALNFLTCASCHGQIPGIAESHIAANVPSTNDFQPFLIRDLTAYLKPIHGAKLTVDYELLRDGPTQSGVGYPKFYLWLRATNAEKTVIDGAVQWRPLRRSDSTLPTSFPAPTLSRIPARLIVFSRRQ